MALLITLEGPDGCGKSTQIGFLKEYFEGQGKKVLLAREPGGTSISEKIREILLDNDNSEMDYRAELFLYAAARAQLVGEVIKPALEAGTVVIMDRFVDSSAVYQGMARGLGVDTVYKVNEIGLDSVKIDLTILLDLPAEEGLKRKKSQHEMDRMEKESLDFHKKVAEGYRELAARNPERIYKVDATKSVEEIRELILDRVKELMK
ncbi:MAG: dTMP kinase [Lachnospiraceae bacterium]|nr:dTMP kinase [Lachnospiraceae bacterium]